MCILNDWSARDLQNGSTAARPVPRQELRDLGVADDRDGGAAAALEPFASRALQPRRRRPATAARLQLPGRWGSRYHGRSVAPRLTQMREQPARADAQPRQHEDLYWTVARMLVTSENLTTRAKAGATHSGVGDLLGTGIDPRALVGATRRAAGLLELTWGRPIIASALLPWRISDFSNKPENRSSCPPAKRGRSCEDGDELSSCRHITREREGFGGSVSSASAGADRGPKPHRANSTARVSRRTVTRISPGKVISSLDLLRDVVRDQVGLVVADLFASTMTRTSRPGLDRERLGRPVCCSAMSCSSLSRWMYFHALACARAG